MSKRSNIFEDFQKLKIFPKFLKNQLSLITKIFTTYWSIEYVQLATLIKVNWEWPPNWPLNINRFLPADNHHVRWSYFCSIKFDSNAQHLLTKYQIWIIWLPSKKVVERWYNMIVNTFLIMSHQISSMLVFPKIEKRIVKW